MNCPVCGVAAGSWHRPGCGKEQCPYCGQPVVLCGCSERLPPLDDRLLYQGCCPWAGACRQFGFARKRAEGRWVACLPGEPGWELDFGRFAQECLWSRPHQRFERRGPQPA